LRFRDLRFRKISNCMFCKIFELHRCAPFGFSGRPWCFFLPLLCREQSNPPSSTTKLFNSSSDKAFQLFIRQSFFITLHLEQSFSPLFISNKISGRCALYFHSLALCHHFYAHLLHLLAPSLLSTSLVTPTSRRPINRHGPPSTQAGQLRRESPDRVICLHGSKKSDRSCSKMTIARN